MKTLLVNNYIPKEERKKIFNNPESTNSQLLAEWTPENYFVYRFNKPFCNFHNQVIYEHVLDESKDFELFEVEINIELFIEKLNHVYTQNERTFLFVYKEMVIVLNINFNKKKAFLTHSHTVTWCVGYDANADDVEYVMSVFKETLSFKKKKKTEKTCINLITSEGGNYYLTSFDIDKPKLNIEINYGNEFFKKYKTIEKQIYRKDKNGLVLFHGIPGSGKTTFITWLLSKLSQEKHVIYIPSSIAYILAEPSFINFIMSYPNSILVIEDAENILKSREVHSSSGLTNILNITDGILGKCLNFKIIATFNTERENIDTALLRKGRLLAEHYFGKLSVNEAKLVAKSIKVDENLIHEEMALCDIYALKEEIDLPESNLIPQKNKIGF